MLTVTERVTIDTLHYLLIIDCLYFFFFSFGAEEKWQNLL